MQSSKYFEMRKIIFVIVCQKHSSPPDKPPPLWPRRCLVCSHGLTLDSGLGQVLVLLVVLLQLVELVRGGQVLDQGLDHRQVLCSLGVQQLQVLASHLLLLLGHGHLLPISPLDLFLH